MAAKIEFNQAQLNEAKETIRKAGLVGPRVYVVSVNKVLTGVRTDSVTEIRKVSTIGAKSARDTFDFKRANYADDSAKIWSTSKSIGIINYSARQTKKGVTVQVKKGEKRKLLKHAFIATMQSGHRGVFWRAMNVETGKLVPRLKIHEIFTSKIPEIFGDTHVITPVLDKAGNRLEKVLEQQLEYELKKVA